MNFDLPDIGDIKDIKGVKNYLHQYKRTLDYLLEGKVNTKNILEVGGWFADENVLMSVDNDVGFSTEDLLPNNLRIWAGSPYVVRTTAPFRVYQDGSMHASTGFIGGWEILDDKLVSSNGLLELNSDGTITSIFNEAGVSGSLVIDGQGVSVYDAENDLRVVFGGLVGALYGIKFYNDDGVFQGMIYHSNTAITMGDDVFFQGQADFDASTTFDGPLNQFNGDVWFNDAVVFNSTVSGLNLQMSDIAGLDTQIDLLWDAVTTLSSSKADVGHTHSYTVTIPDHNHGNPDNLNSGGGTFDVE